MKEGTGTVLGQTLSWLCLKHYSAAVEIFWTVNDDSQVSEFWVRLCRGCA